MSTSPVNVELLKGYVGNDPEIIEQFLVDFRVWTSKSAQQIEAALATRDCAAIWTQAHQLKSSARSVGL